MIKEKYPRMFPSEMEAILCIITQIFFGKTCDL